MNGIYFESGENYNINKDKTVKVTKYINGTVEIADTKVYRNNLKRYKKLSKNEYVDTVTGEIKEYEKNEFKSIDGLKRGLRKLKQILRNNFFGNKNELFLTLTTDEVVTDYDTIIHYFNLFWDKLKRRYKNLEYIYVVELQEDRNSWHIHCMIKDTKNKNLYIENDEIVKLWGQCNTKTNRITKRNIKKIINEEESIAKNCKEEEFGIERLINYVAKVRTKEKTPASKKVYYKSRGIKLAETEKMIYGEIIEKIGTDYDLEYENTVLVRSIVTDKIMNKTKKEYWKDKNGNRYKNRNN